MGRMKILSVVLAVMVTVTIFGCGGSSSSKDSSPNFNASPDNYTSKYSTTWKKFLNSNHYSGYLALKFKTETEMRLRNDVMYSSSNPALAETVNELLLAHGAVVERSFKVEEEVITRALSRAKREGKKLNDWNLFYNIKVKSPGHAEDLYREIGSLEGIEWIHPIPKPVISNVGGVSDLVAEQTYIEPHDPLTGGGGLNIQAAWDVGITGQGVKIVDEEMNWDFDHFDLPIDESDVDSSPYFEFTEEYNTDEFINHGTAVVGLLAALDNGEGITGIAHSSEIKLWRTDSVVWELADEVADLLIDYAEGQDVDPWLRPGDIILMEVAAPGPSTPAATGCNINEVGDEPTYCIPVEAYPQTFMMLEDVTELGVIVVQGAANGGIDLANPAAQISNCGGEGGSLPFDCVDLATDHSGAIMVAASNGQANDFKPWWSNWGNRIDAYAWGLGVATTGYGDHPDSNGENAEYTSNFNGTSSAAALVAGSLALVQSYTKDHYKNIVPHKEVYLDAPQMRELIELTGHASSSSDHIGKKPDVGAMMEAIDNFEVIPHIAPATETLLRDQRPINRIMYDLDKDSRADLITWSGGTWKIDLSTIAPDIDNPNPDNYGSWDREIYFEGCPTGDCIIYPVVHDYDTDGDADLALYDSKNGIWYIKFTTDEVLNAGIGETLTWDLEIDYSLSPEWEPYSRPAPGDYNNDNNLDIGIVTPNGHWLMDFGGIGSFELVGGNMHWVSEFGTIEKDVKFLTDAQLAAAPGWAYMPISVKFSNHSLDLVYKVPDGLEGENIIKLIKWAHYSEDVEYTDLWIEEHTLVRDMHNYGSNENIFVGSSIDYNDLNLKDIAVYQNQNDVQVIDGASMYYYYGDVSQPSWSYQDPCKPIVSDFDGDKKDDFAMMCPDGWHITYHDVELGYPSVYTVSSERTVDLDVGSMSLPPMIYPGGISYQEIQNILEGYDLVEEYQDKDPFTPLTVDCIKHWAPPAPYCLSNYEGPEYNN